VESGTATPQTCVGSKSICKTQSCTSVGSSKVLLQPIRWQAANCEHCADYSANKNLKSPFVFVSERGDPFSNRGFQATVERAGKAAGFGMKIHPHMLRHACGYKLANDGVDTRTIQAYLGHKSIQHTVRYTELAPTRFKSLFRDWAVRSIAVSTKNKYGAAWTANAMSQIHYLPLTPGFFAILVGIFVIVLILRSVRYAFAQPLRRVSEMRP
jgi:hypothetical protein